MASGGPFRLMSKRMGSTSMRWNTTPARLVFMAGGAAAALLFLNACTTPRPALHANVTNGARNVPLSTLLQITADGALIQQAMLQRLDVPSEPILLDHTGKGAELAVELEPDAQYRLVATAAPAATSSLPWQSTPATQISLEQVFSTVETPMLQDEDTTRVLVRGKPLELLYSQPLAKAEVGGANATASISKNNPQVVQIDIANPTPGASFTLDLTDIVGAHGLAGPDSVVAVQVPPAITLTGVSGKSPSARIGLAKDVPVTLDWSRPVTSFEYVVDGAPTTWRGAPTQSVELPLKAVEDRTQALAVTDALAADGGWLVAHQTFEIATANALQLVAMWPVQGEENVNPTTPPIFRFSEEVADRAAAESAITFEPAVAGRFEWLAPNRVKFVPTEAFPTNSEVTVRVDGNPSRIRGASGGYLEEATTATYFTGRLKVIDVSLSKQIMTLYEDDEVVWTAPVATGVRGAPTPPGNFRVQYKVPTARFRGVNPNGSRYDIPNVHWVMPFMGDYTIHGAHWRGQFGAPQSAGCVSLSDPNAKHVYDWSEENTPIVIHI